MSSVEPDHEAAQGSSRERAGLSLQQKSWIVTLGVLIVLGGLLAVGVDRVFRRGADRLEDQWVAESVGRLQTAETAELDALERSARDYATWTDTYEFMGDTTRSFTENNLGATTFANLQLDAFLLFDDQGQLKLGRVFRDGAVTAEGADRLGVTLERSAQRAANSNGHAVKGVLELPEGIALVALLPILHDDASGPPRGALAHIRFLDAARVKRLRDVIDLDLSLRSPLAPNEGRALQLGSNSSFATNVINDHLLTVQVPVNDVEGRMVALWELALPRKIHLESVEARSVFYVVIGVLVLAAAALIGWMLRALVITRVEILQAAMKRARETSDLSERLPLHGADEITSLTDGINHLLAALERGEMTRVLAEQERARLHKQLQEAQKLEAIGTLTGGLAHEFNNLLTSIQGSATLLREESSTDSVTEEHLKRIEQATAQAARLVKQMMTFGRHAPAAFTPVHLPGIVRDALHLLRSSLPKGIEFNFLNEAVDDMVYADAAQLQQVLINLATNSSQAMVNGTGVLTIKISEVQLPDAMRAETAAAPAGNYLRLTMSDTGAGIRPDVLPRIFEPLYTTKPAGTGTGLGLAVAHGIITRHHGTIGVQSEVGRGTTVFIHLPKVSNGTPVVNEHAHMVVPASEPKEGNLLLVDDDALVRETLAAGLRRLGYRTTCAAGGAQALKFVREQRGAFDAVITDQMMPGMMGIELGEIIASENPGLPLLLVTGFASALSEQKVKSLGFSAMLMKPVTIEQLEVALRNALGR